MFKSSFQTAWVINNNSIQLTSYWIIIKSISVSPGLVAAGSVLRDHQGVVRSSCFWLFSWTPADSFCWADGCLWRLESYYSTWLFCFWGGVRFGNRDFILCAMRLCLSFWPSSNFIFWSFGSIKHVYRETTSVADFMANWAYFHKKISVVYWIIGIFQLV